MRPKYTPLLKAKQAELKALQQITPMVKARILPLLEVPPALRDRETLTRPPTEVHLANMASKIADAWGTIDPVMIDLPYVLAPEGNELHPAVEFFEELAVEDVRVIPVVDVRARDSLVKIVRPASAREGLAIRLFDRDLGDARELEYALRRTLARFDLSRADVDLVIDLKSVGKDEVTIRAEGVMSILGRFPSLGAWRSITVLSGAFPESLASLRKNNLRKIPRSDWSLWTSVMASAPKREIRFGDYVIDSPLPFDPENPRAIQVSASIRYASADSWVVVKGASAKINGWEQTRRLCEVLTAQSEWMGASYSKGDEHIAARAKGKVTCGNPTVWRRVGVVHHLTLVTDQLAMYDGS